MEIRPAPQADVAPGGAEQALDVTASLVPVKTICRSLALVGPDASGRFVTRSSVPGVAGARIEVAWDA